MPERPNLTANAKGRPESLPNGARFSGPLPEGHEAYARSEGDGPAVGARFSCSIPMPEANVRNVGDGYALLNIPRTHINIKAAYLGNAIGDNFRQPPGKPVGFSIVLHLSLRNILAAEELLDPACRRHGSVRIWDPDFAHLDVIELVPIFRTRPSVIEVDAVIEQRSKPDKSINCDHIRQIVDGKRVQISARLAPNSRIVVERHIASIFRQATETFHSFLHKISNITCDHRKRRETVALLLIPSSLSVNGLNAPLPPRHRHGNKNCEDSSNRLNPGGPYGSIGGHDRYYSNWQTEALEHPTPSQRDATTRLHSLLISASAA